MAVEALQALAEYAATGEVDAGERVATVEKRGDRLRERNLATLNRAFTTTYDRDLTAIAIRRIDDVANYAKTTVREMGLLAMEPDVTVRAIAELLSAGAVELRAAVAGLGGDPRLVEVHVVRVHKAERRVEKFYRAAFAELFAADARARWRSGGSDRRAARRPPSPRGLPAPLERCRPARCRRTGDHGHRSRHGALERGPGMRAPSLTAARGLEYRARD